MTPFDAGKLASIQRVCAEGGDRGRSATLNKRLARLKARMKPGDIVTTDPRDLDAVGRVYKPLSRMVQGTRFGHSAIYEGRGQVIEGRMGKGVIRRSLKDMAECNELRVVRPRASARQRRDAVSYAREQVGRGFSLKALASGGLKPTKLSPGHKGSKQRRALDALFCSSLIANAYHRVPFNPGRAINDTRPVDILKSKRVKRVGKLG